MGNGIAQGPPRRDSTSASSTHRHGSRARACRDREEPLKVRREGQTRHRPTRRRVRHAARRGTSTPLADADSSSKRSSKTRREDRAVRDARCDHAARLILASNTSSISITKIARRHEASRQSHRHALHESRAADDARRSHPRPRDPDETIPRSRAVEQIGKTRSKPDYPGFIANRVLMPMINEAIFALIEGVGTRGSDRQRDEARHEPPDGTADARRLHRPRRVPRHPARAPRRPRRSEIPPCPLLRRWSLPDGSDARAARVSTTIARKTRRPLARRELIALIAQ